MSCDLDQAANPIMQASQAEKLTRLRRQATSRLSEEVVGLTDKANFAVYG